MHHFACCSDDTKDELTTIELAYGDEVFFTTGLLVLQRSYLDICPYEKAASNYLTEPELISLMNANGISTDATMAEHIAKIKERRCVQT